MLELEVPVGVHDYFPNAIEVSSVQSDFCELMRTKGNISRIPGHHWRPRLVQVLFRTSLLTIYIAFLSIANLNAMHSEGALECIFQAWCHQCTLH